jgi:amidase
LLRRAGCVILGKTATAEFAFNNPPATTNPHNPAHTPGGSSSGSAAAVADSMVPLALGTQTGGSVIRPAAFCGVIGFKPSFGCINRTGVKPVSDSLDTVGFFSDTLEGAGKALHVLSGLRLPDLAKPSSTLRIGFARTSHWERADHASHATLEAAAKHFSSGGAIVAEVDLPPAVEALFVEQGHIMKYEAARALAWEQEKHRGLLSPGIRTRLEDGWSISREQYDRAQRTALEARQQHADLMRSFDVLLTLSAPGEAPKGLASTGDSMFNGLWTLLGVPCITLPWGQGATGLPVGVQLVGAYGGDVALLVHSNRLWKPEAKPGQ